MEINETVIGIVFFIVFILIVILIRANNKDKKNLENFLSDTELDENKEKKSDFD
jgi:hypothetical protein